jgi:predicted Zn-dependent protease
VTGKKEFSLMSESQEIAMGKEYDPSVVAQFGVYNDDKLQAFINEKGQEMAAISHRPQLPYEFKILDSPVVNAFAVPGGYVYFTRGIMAHFNNEAEFAGVLGHEIGHITARHSARQATRQTLAQIALIGGMIASEEFRKFGDVAQQGLGLLLMKYSRDHERESDKLGVEYSSAVGYDAREMAGFFNTLKRLSDGQTIPTFLSTHPDPGDRHLTVGRLAAEAQKDKDPNSLKVNRNNYLQMIDGIIHGDDPRQGFVENQVFYHPDMKFRYDIPAGWKTVNTPSQVQMAPSDGKALMILTLAEGNDLNSAKNNAIQKNKFQVVESTDITVNGLPAIAMISEVLPDPGQQQSGQQEPTLRVLTYLIQYNGLIYKMHGLSNKTDFNTYFGFFQNSMKTFKKLTETDKLNRKPTRVKIVTVNNQSTLQSVLQSYKIPQDKHTELAILNGMELNTSVPAGTMIKILEGQW